MHLAIVEDADGMQVLSVVGAPSELTEVVMLNGIRTIISIMAEAGLANDAELTATTVTYSLNDNTDYNQVLSSFDVVVYGVNKQQLSVLVNIGEKIATYLGLDFKLLTGR